MKHLFLMILFLTTVSGEASAQWQPDSAFYVYRVTGFFPVDTNLFVSLANVQFRFGDTNALGLVKGNVWVERDMNHAIFTASTNAEVTSMAGLGPYVFASDYGSVLRSTDLGYHWEGVGKDSLGNWINAYSAMAVIGSVVTVGNYRSSDSGKPGTWRSVNGPSLSSMAVIGSNIVGGSPNGTWYSTDSGQSWIPTTTYISGSFATIGDTIFSAGSGLLRSTDSGKTWNDITSLTHSGIANCVSSDGKNLFVGTFDSGVVVSTDRGNTWRTEHEGLYDLWISKTDPNWPIRADNIKVNAICVSDSQVWVNVIISSDYRWSTFHRPIREMVDTTLGVVEHLPQGDSIEIYPNPTMDRVSILAGGTSILAVRVLNVLGEQVLSTEDRVPSNMTLDLSKIPSGAYFLEIETPNGTILRKLVKE